MSPDLITILFAISVAGLSYIISRYRRWWILQSHESARLAAMVLTVTKQRDEANDREGALAAQLSEQTEKIAAYERVILQRDQARAELNFLKNRAHTAEQDGAPTEREEALARELGAAYRELDAARELLKRFEPTQPIIILGSNAET